MREPRESAKGPVVEKDPLPPWEYFYVPICYPKVVAAKAQDAMLLDKRWFSRTAELILRGRDSLKWPAQNHREQKTSAEITLDAARALSIERIVSLTMDYQRGVGVVQFRNGVDAVISSSSYPQLIEKLLDLL